jgi:hypothetical protein
MKTQNISSELKFAN